MSLVVVAIAGVAAAALAAGELRTDVVAVVFAPADAGRFSLTVSYSTAVSRQQAETDLGAVQQVTGWRFASPRLTSDDGLTQITATLLDQPAAKGSPVWPMVWALKRFNRVTVLLAGIGDAGVEGDFRNQFVQGTWTGGGGVWCCDITVLDRGFGSVDQLRQSTDPQAAGSASGPLQSRGSWVILAVLALLVGASCYRLLVRRPRTRRG